ncbi:MAG: hypothetical protein RLZZ308_275 [Candidatus Parcubacteria bacterium]|jgi:uracil-DNA glycosylase
MKKEVLLEQEWKEELKDVITSTSFVELIDFLRSEYVTKVIFPAESLLFKAFELTPFSKVTVVILGQDPYHRDGQAMGLSFSVPEGVLLPPSLQNVYKEIESDMNTKKDFSSGNLEVWARQGVFLLNTILSVVAHTPTSHKGKGWEIFTDAVLSHLSDKHSNLVFMLWGNYAKSKKHLIDTTKHIVLEAAHPSPFSAYSGFFGCKHFSQCNTYLVDHHKKPIIW